jgi:hypothetical protein
MSGVPLYGPLPPRVRRTMRRRSHKLLLDDDLAPLWLGSCPACRTSVLVDDDFVRRGSRVFHRECDSYVTRRAWR